MHDFKKPNNKTRMPRFNAKRIDSDAVKDKQYSDLKLDQKTLYFLPIGGTGEFEGNLNMYYYGGYWIIIDLGVSFESLPGANVVMPNVDFIKTIPKDKIVGGFFTHCHEDHGGAAALITRALKIKLYGTAFTMKLIEWKVKDIGSTTSINVVNPGVDYKFGPFTLKWINVTHSIPEGTMISIKTEGGNVLHTGDWKFDAEPLVGPTTNFEALEQVAKEGVLALVGDSTNSHDTKKLPTEGEVKAGLRSVLSGIKTGRIVVVCFSTNLARVMTAISLAKEFKRKPGLFGRSLLRIRDAALEFGYLKKSQKLYDEMEMSKMNPDEMLMVGTGSQAEINSGLRRLAEDAHPRLRISAGDTVVISARAIPGREAEINDMLNKLAKRGVNIITMSSHQGIHVSGHPTQHDMTQLYKMVKPQFVIPVHGDYRSLQGHAKFAESLGIGSAIVANGDVVRLSQNNGLSVVDTVPCSKMVLDGKVLVPREGTVMSERSRLEQGIVFVSIVIRETGNYKLYVNTYGLCELEDEFRVGLREVVLAAIKSLKHKDRRMRPTLISAVRKAVLHATWDARLKSPFVSVHATILEKEGNNQSVLPQDTGASLNNNGSHSSSEA